MVSASDSDSPSSEPRSSTTTGATPPTFHEAAHAVLNTNELLCEVVGYLPLEDIVVATGVCKTWRYALKVSHTTVAIKKALFLAPTDIRRITTSTEDIPKRVEDIPREINGIYAVVGEVNPFFARICDPLLSVNADYISQPQTMPQRRNFEHPAGLWRKMLITQPPTSHVSVSLCPNPIIPFTDSRPWMHVLPYRERSDSLRCDEGVRMGQVYDLIELKAQAFQGEIFAVSIHMSNFHSNHNRSYGWDWEVCNGMVVREIPGVLPDLISVSSDDES
jgi:hypothetical protein